MAYLDLDQQEREEVEELIKGIQSKGQPLNEVLDEMKVLSDSLPLRLREVIHRFALKEEDPYLIVRNFEIDNEAIARTPLDYPQTDNTVVPTREELFFLLTSSRLGEVFTWDSIQDGRIINDVIPIKKNEDTPTSSGSKNDFGLHTEDSFTTLRGEYFSLGCLRNEDQVPTTISCVEDLKLPDEVQKVLFQSRFFIRNNMAHRIKMGSEYSPILSGDPDKPYIRINTITTEVEEGDEEAAAALKHVCEELRNNVRRISLNQGELLLLD